MKIENYLRMAALPYECPRGAELRKSPKGKMPYIEDYGNVIADSSFIVDYLKAKYGDTLDGHLDGEQKAVALAFRRMLEENTYWAVLYARWFDTEGWNMTRRMFFGDLTFPLNWLVPAVARRAMWKELYGQGMGRHAPGEIISIGKRDLTALSDFLRGKAFFMGEQPSSLDATAYAFLANVIEVPLDNEFKRHVCQYRNLVAYCQRMKARYYG